MAEDPVVAGNVPKYNNFGHEPQRYAVEAKIKPGAEDRVMVPRSKQNEWLVMARFRTAQKANETMDKLLGKPYWAKNFTLRTRDLNAKNAT